MKFSSLHTHTLFCDGRDDMETMCRRAREKGLASIGFSAHAPITGKTGIVTDWHLKDNLLDEYIAAVTAARRRWEGKLPVYLGLEVDYIKGMMGPADRDLQNRGLDFIIGSVHYIVPPNGAPPFTVDGPMEELEQGLREGFGGSGAAVLNAYWDAVGDMIAAGGFDILGHADIVKKNNRGDRWFKSDDGVWQRRTAEIAHAAGRAAAIAGIAVEINTGGLNRKKTADPYPSLPFLRYFRENAVPVIITADAHCAEDLDGHYDTAVELLLEAGYTEHVLFEGRQDGKALWTTENLLPPPS
ncbi:MAG: histidinol-phosphatase [Treponema sp.]|jgi:histidinol-phosphatase (PHP family)|nr:histidinol-phosphatase [Treponema sp.]